MSGDLVQQYDSFSAVVRDRTNAIHKAILAFPHEEWVTQERLELAQKIANRLHEVVKEFHLETEQ